MTTIRGTIDSNGELIRKLSARRAARFRNRHLGFVFQSFNLMPFMNAVENVALPLYYQGVSRRKRLRTAEEYLERVGLLEWANHRPTEMSGGQKQRVAIARALIGKPRVIFADEPTGALDSGTSEQIMELLEEVHREGITIVVVTHEADIAARTQPGKFERRDIELCLSDGIRIEVLSGLSLDDVVKKPKPGVAAAGS